MFLFIYSINCLLIRYSFIFDSFGASQAVCKNLWYITSPLWKIICLLLGWYVVYVQAAQKINILLADINKYLASRTISFEFLTRLTLFLNLSLFHILAPGSERLSTFRIIMIMWLQVPNRTPSLFRYIMMLSPLYIH